MRGTGEQRAGAAHSEAEPLRVDEITGADDPRFGELALCERMVPLRAEREPPEAFFEVLALNRHAERELAAQQRTEAS